MKERVNCMNCNAPLHYDETNYGNVAKCGYCGSEYHIDKLGRVEEYKVKLKMHNKIVHFYIGSMQYEPSILHTSYITSNGECRYKLVDDVPNITLELHSYGMEDIE